MKPLCANCRLHIYIYIYIWSGPPINYLSFIYIYTNMQPLGWMLCFPHFTFGSLAPVLYFSTFLLLGLWLHKFTSFRFHFWANGSRILLFYFFLHFGSLAPFCFSTFVLLASGSKILHIFAFTFGPTALSTCVINWAWGGSAIKL